MHVYMAGYRTIALKTDNCPSLMSLYSYIRWHGVASCVTCSERNYLCISNIMTRIDNLICGVSHPS